MTKGIRNIVATQSLMTKVNEVNPSNEIPILCLPFQMPKNEETRVGVREEYCILSEIYMKRSNSVE